MVLANLNKRRLHGRRALGRREWEAGAHEGGGRRLARVKMEVDKGWSERGGKAAAQRGGCRDWSETRDKAARERLPGDAPGHWSPGLLR
eukprot:scaffold12517_cov101-Isochrysis_galbana.AAC.1